MDWQLAITRNRDALLTIIIALMKSVGLVAGGQLTTLPRFLYARALLIIRQAESTVRRLIVIAAHEMSLRGIAVRKPRASQANFLLFNKRSDDKAPAFNLIDPLKDFSAEEPDFDEPDPTTNKHCATPDRTPTPAAMLGKRLLALKHALDTIETQAKRLTRWYAARDGALQHMRPRRMSPMRPGLAPASRKRRRTELDEILRECHLLALYTRERQDSS
jgi:hypothetical protein